ncbi:MAG: DUF362 domain-containing protein [Promethearchaeota archaeon]|jgi:uncharacterized protein (DUF362 family)
MKDQLELKSSEVAIIKDDTPKECVLKGIETLGGISKFIEKGDQVFIKYNLCFPSGFPTNTNFDTLASLVTVCKEAEASKIYIGSYTSKDLSIKLISDYLNLEERFSILGAELVFLDNSNFIDKKGLKKEKLNELNNEFLSNVQINDKEYLIPKIILDSDKIISVNQVNVNPLFELNLSLLNWFSIVSPKYQELGINKNNKDVFITADGFENYLISNILDIYTIKRPNLVINDLFYLLEGAGPCIYKDSNLKKTNFMVFGNDAVSVDLITLKLLNLETQNYNLLLKANEKELGIINLQKIKIFGEELEDNVINIDLCVKKLESINIMNFTVKTGKYCSGCYNQAYHFLNFMKTNMVKDLKYNPRNVLLIGQSPSEPEDFKNILLFGDCAIESTRNSNFRKVEVESKKNPINELKAKTSKKQKSKDKPKIRLKSNKKILELPGCPPNLYDCITSLIKYYGKSNTPNLTFFKDFFKFMTNSKMKEKLKSLEVI